MRNPASKIITLESALFWRQGLRRNGNTLVITNGCFDLFHAGHLQSLCTAAAMGDALLVLLNSDQSISSLKGPTRPIIPQAERALLLAGLSCVSCVVIFENARCDAELAVLAPDVYCKSKEYQGRLDPAEEAALVAAETSIVFIPVSDGISTSQIIQKIQAGGGVPPPPAPPADGQRADLQGAIADGKTPAATAPVATNIATGTVPELSMTKGNPELSPDHSQAAPTACPRPGASFYGIPEFLAEAQSRRDGRRPNSQLKSFCERVSGKTLFPKSGSPEILLEGGCPA